LLIYVKAEVKALILFIESYQSYKIINVLNQKDNKLSIKKPNEN